MQPIAVFRGGNFPTEVTDNLLEYIASPSVRQQCKYCSNHEMVVHDCPLLLQVNSQTDPYIDTQAIHHASKIYCLPIQSNNKELGYLNLYFSNGTLTARNTREVLDLLSTLTTLCLNNLRPTRQVQEAQRQTQTIRQKENVAVIIRDLLRENPDNSKATWIDKVQDLIADVRYNAHDGRTHKAGA